MACSTLAAAQSLGDLNLTDASGIVQAAYGRGDEVYLSVTDADRNTSGSADTMVVRVTSGAENTGAPASATVPDGSGNVGDGPLTVSGVGLNTQTENWSVTAISATEFVVSGSVSGAQGRNLLTTDTTYSTDNDEISLALTVGNFAFTAGDRFTFSTTAAVIVAETLTLTETGNTTGVFTGSITLSEVPNPVANNGVLEIQPGNQITALYDDPSGDFNAPDQVRTQAIYAATIVPGTTLLSNTIWTKANSPYLLTGDLTVDSGVSLIIDPGVTVLFLANSDSTSSGNYNQDSELIINGNLVARGTSTERITFASSSASPAAGDWGEIRLNGMGVNFEYVDIKHANRGINAQNQADGDTLRIANSRFTLNNNALYHNTQSTGAQVVVRDNTFTNTTNTVIESNSGRTYYDPQWQVIDNTATGFGSYTYGLYLRRAGNLEITGNSFTTTQATQGFYLEGYGTRSVISGNTVSVGTSSNSCCYHGISYYGNDDNETLTFTGNQITGGEYGLQVGVPNNATTTISNNSVTGTERAGVYISNYNNNNNVTVQNNTAEDNSSVGINLEGTVSVFSGNIMRRNQIGLSLYVTADAQSLNITDNIISDNTDTGITTGYRCCSNVSNITVTVTNNDLSGNGNYAIYNNRPYDIDARQNWWGTDETAAIESGSNPKQLSFIYDGQDNGNTSAGAVSYAGWLDSAGGSMVVPYLTGSITLTDASGVSQPAFESGDRVYLSVTDADRSTTNGVDTLTVRITSETENTGTVASATAPNGSGNIGTGTLTVSGVGLNTQTENWSVTAISATEFVVSGSVSGAQGRNLLTTDTTYSTDNDEISLALTVGNFAFTAGDRFTFSTTAAVIVAETLTLTETGNTTGVFTGSITLSEVPNPVANNGVLEIQPGNQITALYDDPSGDFNAPDQVRTQAIYAATIVPGTTLLSNTIWTKANSPYLLTGDLTVDSGVSLIIDPGVTVLFLANSDSTSSGNYNQDSELIINGNLVARGTSTERITFASSSASPAAGDWGEIRLNGMGVNFEYVDIKHANRGINAQNQADGDTLRIANSRFTLNNNALYHNTQSTGAQVVVRDNTFTNTTNTVIESNSGRTYYDPQWQVIDNTATGFGNYNYGLYLSRAGNLEITGNSFTTTTQATQGFYLEGQRQSHDSGFERQKNKSE